MPNSEVRKSDKPSVSSISPTPQAGGWACSPDWAGKISERIRRMPPLHRRVLALYYFRNLRLSEIAKRCHQPERVIAQVYAQCLPAIHEAMQEVRI